ncbi:MAG: UDP-glucose--hexose-1-phosphate uridylyltransferase [Elusimicrobium sp.]|nr:UDP-glucose--hexose-1-phosphate uridylyltransferase [Elusimicrobium sp.]
MINALVSRLIDYAVKNKLIEEEDRVWAANRIISRLGPDGFTPAPLKEPLPKYPSEILAAISAWAASDGKIEDLSAAREMLETEIIGLLTPRPSDFTAKFKSFKDIKKATRWMYEAQQTEDYIKTERVAKNLSWTTPTRYGRFDITVNLSKPEKDPKEIAAVKALGVNALKDGGYPKCALCVENEGYAGRLNYPARQNIRLIPLKLAGEKWFFQYSPYVYYKEHCIVLGQRHTDMLINEKTFVRLADFLEQFPHYFIGSNADLPVVGGSILNHDHYQGGNYVFPMHRAKIRKTFKLKKFPRVKCEILDWPLSVIRFTGARKNVLAAANELFKAWVNYNDAEADIKSHSGATRHNTVTPIARMKNGRLQLDIALRNNAASAEFPDGIFHSRPQYHHIKRENIGLIEVMGMAVLPGRLKAELKEVGGALAKGDLNAIKNSPAVTKHYNWAARLAKEHKFTTENAFKILEQETGKIFAEVLECCGVFKDDAAGRAALDKFILKLNK